MSDTRPCPNCKRELPRLAFLSTDDRERARETFLCAECHARPTARRAVSRARLRAPLGFPCMSCARVRPESEFDALPGRLRRRLPTTCRECVDKIAAQLIRKGFAPERKCIGPCALTLPLREFVRAGRIDVDPRCPHCRIAQRRESTANYEAKIGKRVGVKKRTDVDWHAKAHAALYPGVSYDKLDWIDRTRVYLLCVELMRERALWPAPTSAETPDEESHRLAALHRLVARADRAAGRTPLAAVIATVLPAPALPAAA